MGIFSLVSKATHEAELDELRLKYETEMDNLRQSLDRECQRNNSVNYELIAANDTIEMMKKDRLTLQEKLDEAKVQIISLNEKVVKANETISKFDGDNCVAIYLNEDLTTATPKITFNEDMRAFLIENDVIQPLTNKDQENFAVQLHLMSEARDGLDNLLEKFAPEVTTE